MAANIVKAAGELHTTRLDLESVQEEAQSWKAKWHEVTASLDTSVARATRSGSDLELARKSWQADQAKLEASHRELLEKAQRENESLRVRNGNLGETIEFANRQIESLSEDISQLVSQTAQADEALANAQQDNERIQKNQKEAQQRVLTLEGQLADYQGNLDDANATLQSVREDSKAQAGRVFELERELSAEDQRYRDAMLAAEAEQSALTRQLDGKDAITATTKAELAKQKSINTELSARCEELQKNLVQLNEKLAGNLQQAQAHDAEVQMLKYANQQLEESLAAAQQVSDSAAKKVEVAEVDLVLSIEQCNRLQEQLREAQTTQAATQTHAATQSQQDAESIASLQEALAAALAQQAQLEELRSAETKELEKLAREHDHWVDKERDLIEQVNSAVEAGRQKRQELEAEIERLTTCVGQAQDSNSQREAERNKLAVKVEALSVENSNLKSNLKERSTLVRELEAERGTYTESLSARDMEQEKLQRQLSELQHRVTTFQDHAQTLEGKLLTQQGLMSELEAELSHAQSDQVSALKAAESQSREARQTSAKVAEELTEQQHRSDDLQSLNIELQKRLDGYDVRTEELVAEVERERKARIDQQNGVHSLQAELDSQQKAHRKELAELAAQFDKRAEQNEPVGETSPVHTEQLLELQQLLRERTEELDKMRWREDQLKVAPDDNIAMILNQQLADAREENTRLRAKLKDRDDEEHTPQADDLTELKGIGEKLVEQLEALGITQFKQIAQLDINSLEVDEHPLQGFKARILRDEWVEQAKAKLKIC